MSLIFVGYIHAQTDRAVLLQDHWWEAPEWMPKSQITISEQAGSIEVLVSASDWICGQKALREFTYRPMPEEEEGK